MGKRKKLKYNFNDKTFQNKCLNQIWTFIPQLLVSTISKNIGKITLQKKTSGQRLQVSRKHLVSQD